jgi:hypothetical protein
MMEWKQQATNVHAKESRERLSPIDNSSVAKLQTLFDFF